MVIGFDLKNYELNLLDLKQDSFNPHTLLLKFKDWNFYNEECIYGISFRILTIENDIFYLVDGDRKGFIKQTPLYTHVIEEIDEDFFYKIKNSLLFLKQHMSEKYKIVQQNVQVIANVNLNLRYEDEDSTITSCSLPTIPNMVFLSKKALVHVPPNNIYDSQSIYIFAENLYHEALHQIINANILCRDVLPEAFSSLNSIKIPIPWRTKQKEVRNKQWELDRVLHATVVYANLIPFRKEIVNNSTLEKNQLIFFEQALVEASTVFNYLLKSLLNYKGHFAKDGIDIINQVGDYYLAKKITN